MALVPAAVRATIAAALSTEHRGAQTGPHRDTLDDCGLASETLAHPSIGGAAVRPRSAGAQWTT